MWRLLDLLRQEPRLSMGAGLAIGAVLGGWGEQLALGAVVGGVIALALLARAHSPPRSSPRRR